MGFRSKKLLYFCIFLSFSHIAKADELWVRRSISVYDKPKTSSHVIMTLDAGDRVPIFPGGSGDWRRVRVYVAGEERDGYVSNRSLMGSRLSEKNSSKGAALSEIFHKNYGVGLMGSYSYQTQSGWVYSDGQSADVQITSMSGSSFYFGLMGQIPIANQWSLQPYLSIRSSDMKGSAKSLAVGIVSADTAIRRQISFLAFGAMAQYYLSATGNFWVGSGVEIAKATTLSLTLGDSSPSELTSALPTLIFLFASLGYDFHINSHYFIQPQLRLACGANAKPIWWSGEMTVSGVYGF